MFNYTLQDFNKDVEILADKIRSAKKIYKSVFPVPQGGVPLGMALFIKLGLPLVDKPRKGVLVVDDLIDSGTTRMKYAKNDFACIHVKKHVHVKVTTCTYAVHESIDDWVVYWWEGSAQKSIEDVVTRTIEFIGDNPNREGVIETPSRVVRAWTELFEGYKQKPEQVCKTFDGDQIGGLVYLKNVEFYSFCEHHMLPFYGVAHIGYIPNGRVIGASKLARILDIYARRLQIQERIGEQVTNALMEYLKPIGAACVIEAKHLCIACRGVRKQHSILGYSSFKGVFLENTHDGVAARNEFLSLIRN